VGFFGRLLGREPREPVERVPDWASFFGPADWRAFVDVVEHTLAEQGYEATRRGGNLAVRLPDGRPLQVGLQTLAQRCHDAERRDWPVLVAAHLAAVQKSGQEADTFDRTDFAQVRERLKVRLYPAAAVDADDELRLVVTRPASELVEALVYDHPHTVASVPPDDLQAWGPSEAELFDIARENTRDEPFVRDRVDAERGVTVRVVHGESLFVAAQLLFLERHLPPAKDRPWGALAAVPTRHLLLYHSIEDARVLIAINAMIPLILLHHRKGPGSLVPELYWYRPDGSFTVLPTGVSPKGVTFKPTQEFIDEVMVPLGA